MREREEVIEMRYLNLKAELARKGISIEEVSKVLGIHRNSVSNKINGDTSFTVGNDGGAWNPTGNMPAENMRRKRGSVMERKELQYIPIQSQSQQRVRELAARLYRSDAQRLFWFRVAVGCAAVTAVATGAMMAIAQSAAMF